jgi:hypothetical protein
MTYSTITKETFNTICIAYPDKGGVDTKKSLNDYEAKSQGCIDLIFVDSKKEAIDTLKTF